MSAEDPQTQTTPVMETPKGDMSEEKENDRRVHVGNLSWSTDEDNLTAEFAKFGIVEDVKIIKERGRSKGYGFITFGTATDASLAVEKLNKADVGGRSISVDFARPRDQQPAPKANVHVAKLPESVDDEKLRAFFGEQGEVEDARVVTRQGVSSGYGFVRFTSVEAATQAIEALNGKELEGQVIEVAFARRTGERPPHRPRNQQPRRNQQEGDEQFDGQQQDDEFRPQGGRRQGGRRQGGGRQRRSRTPDHNGDRDEQAVVEAIPDDEGRKLYVGGLSEITNEECLRLNFSAYGELDSCEVVRNTRTNRSRAYAFVTFETAEQATEAVEKLNGVEIDEKEILVEFARSGGKRAGGRRPMARRRGGGGGRRGYRRGGGGGGRGGYQRRGDRRGDEEYAPQGGNPQQGDFVGDETPTTPQNVEGANPDQQ